MGDCVRWERTADDIVVLTFDDPDRRVNTLNEMFLGDLAAAVTRLQEERETIRGVVVTSAKDSFVAGGDLQELFEVDRDELPSYRAGYERMKANLRALETLGIPVVSAIQGPALGGGFEIALATHRRVVVADVRGTIGLPEVTLGLLPGGGGVARTVRLIGLVDALDRVLLTGQRFTPAAALELGLVDEVVASRDDLLPAAVAWITSTDGAVTQVWDTPDYRMPGGDPRFPPLAGRLADLPATLRSRSNGSPVPAEHHIVCAATEGSVVDIDSALAIESRYFLDLVVSQPAKNMIQAFWFDRNEIAARTAKARSESARDFSRIAIIGAGMMGAGIALVSALAGLDVLLKDVTTEAAERGKDYSRSRLRSAVNAGRMTQEAADATLDRIHPTDSFDGVEGRDLVIEAVFENEELKRAVYAELDAVMAPGSLLASNTSSLPITGLAHYVQRPADFIGLHFFSPVDRMPLVEVIRGVETSDATLAAGLTFAALINKTAIVVNDGRGFFTSRVIEKYVYEAMAMLTEGVPPASIEQASRQAGYPVGALQLCDELNLETLIKIRDETRAGSPTYRRHPAEDVLEAMEAQGRTGRLRGAGFFEYDGEGRRTRMWPGLADLYPPSPDLSTVDVSALGERMLVAEAIDAARCVEEGVIRQTADANIGSILGIGFPKWTGGVLQYINGFDGGVSGFVARADELAEAHGARFAPADLLREAARTGTLV